MQLPFGEWLPDQPDHLNPGSTVATNVYHAQSSYKPVKGLVAYSGASNVTQNAKGAGSFRDNTNTVFTCLLYTSPSPRDLSTSRMPSSA